MSTKYTYKGEVVSSPRNDLHVYRIFDEATGNYEHIATLNIDLLQEALEVGSRHLGRVSEIARVDVDLIQELDGFTSLSVEDHCSGAVTQEAIRNMRAIVAAEEVVLKKFEIFAPTHPEYVIYQKMRAEIQKQKQDICLSYVSTVFSTPNKLAQLFNYLDQCQKERYGQETAASILASYVHALSAFSQRRLWAKTFQSLNKESASNNSGGELDQAPSWAQIAAAIELSTFTPPPSALSTLYLTQKIARIAPVLAEIEVHLTSDVFDSLLKQRRAYFRKLRTEPQNRDAAAFLPVFDLLVSVSTLFGLKVPTEPVDEAILW